ncbi:MAG: aminotransferase class III-fold pyridoxal phosphate-dependent enzyme [Coriobacteriales bacterium]|jgi:acetylornithine aminotransferase|nr:aminotransferase class III-fold pyridoxal phosphate-dependent enzyme [Coriobacteriales bacterium]
MSYLEQKNLESVYMMGTYARKPVEFVSGKGTRLYDSEGREYLDFLAGIGCVNLGHSNEAVVQAICAQAHKLVQVGNYYYSESRGELARDLSALLNEGAEGDAGAAPTAPWKTFFANSGAEANEGAIKLARKYGKLYLNGAGTVLTAKRSFHGRTLVTTAATGQEAKQESFAPMPSGFAHFEPGDLDNLKHVLQAATQSACEQGRPDLAPVAVMLECIQGEGGVWPLDEEYLRSVRALTAQQGMLLIIDEVQTGFFRTGRAFSFMQASIVPDVVTMAKGIANGFPMAAVAATGKAAEVLVPGEHGSTFGGNPLAIAAARATLAELIAQDLDTKALSTGTYFAEQLATLPHVQEVRGRGLMLALSLDVCCAPRIVGEALEHGMVLNAIGESIVRFLPPLTVSTEEIDELIGVLKGLLEVV